MEVASARCQYQFGYDLGTLGYDLSTLVTGAPLGIAEATIRVYLSGAAPLIPVRTSISAQESRGPLPCDPTRYL